MGKYFAENISHSAIIARLVNQLESDCRSDYTLLSHFTKNLVKALSAQIRREPRTSGCCSRLLSVVQPFLKLIDSFHDKAQRDLLNKLKIILADKRSSLLINSDEVDNIMVVTGQYANALLDYNDTFNSFLFNESQDKCGVAVISHIEQYLLKLTNLLERLFFSIGSTQDLLKSWKLQLASREEQELYN